jgi:glucosamine--fructose-6-phosphate aminotransferase (isomerizing)
MATEIAEVPGVVERSLRENRSELTEVGKLFQSRRPTHLLTCGRGSSDHAAQYLKYLTEIVLGTPCCSLGPSIVSIYGARLALSNTVLVAISQSGKSPDLLSLVDAVRGVQCPVIALTNDLTSPLARASNINLSLGCGTERSVAATKTFMASAALAASVVARWGPSDSLAEGLARLPDALEAAGRIRWPLIEEVLHRAESMYVLGRGPSLPIASEAALKLKETSAIHAEAYSSAEVLHGPLELAKGGFPVLIFAPSDDALPSNNLVAERMQSAGAQILQPHYHRTSLSLLDPLSIMQTFYGAAERISRARGRDPDQPRLLTKVTQTI